MHHIPMSKSADSGRLCVVVVLSCIFGFLRIDALIHIDIYAYGRSSVLYYNTELLPCAGYLSQVDLPRALLVESI